MANDSRSHALFFLNKPCQTFTSAPVNDGYVNPVPFNCLFWVILFLLVLLYVQNSWQLLKERLLLVKTHLCVWDRAGDGTYSLCLYVLWRRPRPAHMAAICGALVVERKFSRKRGGLREHMERGKSEMSCSTRAGMCFSCFIDGLMLLEDTRNNCSDFCGLPCIFRLGLF